MKKIMLLPIVVLALVSCGSSTPYDSFRKENKEDIAFTMSASNFITGLLVDDEDFREVRKVLKGVKRYRVLLGTEENSLHLEEQFNTLVKRKGYESLMYVNSDGSRIGLYYYQQRNKVKEVIMKVMDNDDFVVLSAEGNIKIEDLDRLVSKAIAEAE